MKHCYDKEAISAHKTRIYILLHKAPNLNGTDSQLCSLSLAQSLIFKQNRTGPNRNERSVFVRKANFINYVSDFV